MSKRFTDTDKWERPWFRKLPTTYKLLWQYIIDKCDLAGIWYVDFELAAFVIGENPAPDEALKLFQKQVQILGDGSRWFIRDFPAFQYGRLVLTNNLHLSVLARLRSLNLAPDLPQNTPSSGAKVRVKEKESLSLGGVGGFEKFWAAYPKRKSKGAAEKAFERCRFTKEQLESVLAAIERAKTSDGWRKDGGQFIPYPASWLNAKGWEDDYAPMVEKREVVG